MIKSKVILSNVSKKYDDKLLFNNLSLEITNNEIIAITGKNGSGKSTLLKIIAGIVDSTNGKISYINDNNEIKLNIFKSKLGFVAPYLFLYNEYTAMENLEIISKIRNNYFDKKLAEEYLNMFGLKKRRNDYLRNYSSGMQQRIKIVLSIIHKPAFLLLDEPTNTLDLDGKNILWSIIDSIKENSLIILASNEESEIIHSTNIVNLENSY